MLVISFRGATTPGRTSVACAYLLETMLERLCNSGFQSQQIRTHRILCDNSNPHTLHTSSAFKTSAHCTADYGNIRSFGSQAAAHLAPLGLAYTEKLSSWSSTGMIGRRPAMFGWYGPEIWRDRKDLQPCQAILDENLAKTEFTATIIDGKLIAEEIRQEIAEEIMRLKSQTNGKVPGLAVVLVGSRKDSETYVRSKKKACKEVGIISLEENLPVDSSEEEVLNIVRKFNDDPSVHGILVQLPLPKHMNEERVLAAISVEKDVDGFHPLNIGKLAMQGRTPLFVPCTPRGCIELLLRSNVEIKGKRAVVIGRSNIVGTPAAMLLQVCFLLGNFFLFVYSFPHLFYYPCCYYLFPCCYYLFLTVENLAQSSNGHCRAFIYSESSRDHTRSRHSDCGCWCCTFGSWRLDQAWRSRHRCWNKSN
ncbi:hypothetical protein KP509_10G022400 [Ceratopteris richardii]|uniref:Methenyltetrahydrofolate cyclohydrolase n=1 Tax=Ceratopteris richardii TaxID=49495 RepID=A0A8T2U2V6_CERRI|nr:hypothetical protein KP509_10G022400 [Ceratopteris richardii]